MNGSEHNPERKDEGDLGNDKLKEQEIINNSPTTATASPQLEVKELNPNLHNVINEGVESAIKKVIEESVQHVLINSCDLDYGDEVMFEALSMTVEDSLQDMIHHFNMEDKKQSICTTNSGEDEQCKLVPCIQVPVQVPQCLEMGKFDNVEKTMLFSSQCESHVLCHDNYEEAKPKQEPRSSLSNSQGTSEQNHTENKLQSWKDAGKALKEALCRFSENQRNPSDIPLDISDVAYLGNQTTDCIEEDALDKNHSVSSPSQDDVSSSLKFSHRDAQSRVPNLKSKHHPPVSKQLCNVAQNNISDNEVSSMEASLIRSMEQSFAWKNEVDPMNQMWENYQYGQIPPRTGQSLLSGHLDDQSDEKFQSLTKSQSQVLNESADDELCDTKAGGDARPVESSDPTLAELREKMRQLVSSLPIMANQPQKPAQNGLSSDIGLRIHRSPKNPRRRHRRSSKEDPLVPSDDEKESECSKRIPPKLSKTTHKISKSGVSKVAITRQQDDIETEVCIKDTVDSNVKKSKRNEILQSNNESMPELVSESSSDLAERKPVDSASQDILPSTVNSQKPAKPEIEHNGESADRTTESESGCTDTDKQPGSGLKETESVANLADIESCESEKEKHSVKQSDNSPVRLGSASVDEAGVNGLGSDDDSMPSLESESSDEDVASLKLAEKFCCKIDKRNLSDDDDLELFEDLPDLVLSSDSATDDDMDMTLSQREMESLQDIYITDSSDAEAGVEGDDEFECDCNLCQYPKEASTTSTHGLTAEAEDSEDDQFGVRYMNDLRAEFRIYESDSEDEHSSPPPVNLIPTLSPLGLLTSDSYRRDFLDLMFTNVIMHMLSVYPDLLNEHTPPPVPEDIFESFSVINVTQAYLDDEVSCPICLCQFVLEEQLKRLPCSHFFHPLCIQAWLQKAGTCPVCRHNLSRSEPK